MSNNNYRFPTAPLDSPAFTGVPTAPTAAPGTNTTQLATTAFVAAGSISGLTVNRVPKATSTTAIGNSQIFDNGTNIGVNTTSPQCTFDTNGRGRFRNNLLVNNTVDYGFAFQVSDLPGFRIKSDGEFGRHQGLNFNTVNWNLAGINSQVQLGTAGSAYENQLVIVCQEGPVRINPYGTNYTNRSVIIGNTTGRTEKLQVDGTSFFSGTALVGTGTASASAILDINSTSQGFGLPQLTNAAILAIATPKNGLMVYNTTINHPCFYNGTAWQRVSNSPM